jgi:hypothetical protein
MEDSPKLYRRISSARIRPRSVAVLAASALAFGTTGCVVTLSPLAKNTTTFSTATATVVTNSEAAYSKANTLHQQEQVSAAIDAYDTAGWSPYTATKPLLTPDQIAARTKVLEGLKAYADALAALTETKNRNKALDTSATTAGTNLQSLTAAGATDLKTLFPGLSALSATETSGVSTAIDGLARLLLNTRARNGLAKATTDMDPSVQALCKLIDSDARILRREADRDYQGPITNENQFIQNAKMDPALRRAEIAKLVTLAAQQTENDAMLAQLQQTVLALGKAHTALMNAANGKDPENLKQRLDELVQFATNLGAYYANIPVSTD